LSPEVEHAIIAFCGALRVAQRLTAPADRETFVASASAIFSKAFAGEIAILAAEEITAMEAEWARS
jgi:predicted regulator of Ras-like GTPase activity (Roadblock/LC7/MglB family)